MSPTARSLKLLRDHGWTAAVVERWNQYAKIRQDLFGFIDIVAVHPGFSGVLAVQATTFDNRLARVKKVCREPRAEVWIAASNQIEVHGWRKQTGKKWEPNITRIAPKRSRPKARSAPSAMTK